MLSEAPSEEEPTTGLLDAYGQDVPLPVCESAERDLGEAFCADVTLTIEGLVLDEPTLVNSSVLSYLAMAVSLIERCPIGREQLLQLLRRSMRQRSIGSLTPRQYVLRYLQQHPP
jgi:hypothetical protein